MNETNFRVFQADLPLLRHTLLLEEVVYEGRIYKLYEVECPLGLIEKAARWTKGLFSDISPPKKIKAIFINPSCSRMDQLRQIANAVIPFPLKSKDEDCYFAYYAHFANLSPLQNADVTIKRNKDVVLAAIRQNVEALDYADDNLKHDRDFVLAAVGQNAKALYYADESLKKDKNFVLAAVRKNGRALCYANQIYRQDMDVVLAAIRQNGKDREVVWAAVCQNGYALYYADESLKGDWNIVLAAVRQNGYALQYADESLKRSKHFLQTIISQNRKDSNIALVAVQQNAMALEYIDSNLKQYRQVVLAAVRQNGYALQFADESLKQDREIVLAAIQQEGRVFLLAHRELKLDPHILEATYSSLDSQLSVLAQDPSKREALLAFASNLLDKQADYFLHDEHPLLQQLIETRAVAAPSFDLKDPYNLYTSLQKTIEQEPLAEGFAAFRKRANLKSYTFADIPDDIISLNDLFESIEKRGINQDEVAALCSGSTFEEVKGNLLGFGKLIPSLLAQKGKPNDPLPLTTRYLYCILKEISLEDDIRENDKLSNRENRLLKFASLVKACQTGQADAIEQYYIYSVDRQSDGIDAAKIENTVDTAVQIALKKTLASEPLLKELTGQNEVKQQSHQSLYLQNRYHKQIGLLHHLRFDPHTRTLYNCLIGKKTAEVLDAIKHHLKLQKEVKEALDKALKAKSISYSEFIRYFEKEFGLKNEYEHYVEFDEELNPNGITSKGVEEILRKLKYLT
jgi:hypothetical protein